MQSAANYREAMAIYSEFSEFVEQAEMSMKAHQSDRVLEGRDSLVETFWLFG